MRTPEQCGFRELRGGTGQSERTCCRRIALITGVSDPDLAIVKRDACEACCRSLSPGSEINPIIASLVYSAAGRIIQAGGCPGCDAERAKRLRQRILNHLGYVPAGTPDICFPPELPVEEEDAAFSNGGTERARSRLNWNVGLLTAPRPAPTILTTLRSLRMAGFGPVHIFAEPGSWLPEEFGDYPRTVHLQRRGNIANFYSSLVALHQEQPDADGYAVFQDDVRIAGGLRAWCEGQFWPLGVGLVSLFTPRVHAADEPGWHLLSSGFYRVFGGQALVFRRDVLRQFLADPQVLHELHHGRHNDDAVVSAWATRQGLPIAYHTPSVVQHIGVVSSIYENGPDPRVFADAVDSVEQIVQWSPPPRRPGKIGLVGWNTASGLGYQTHDLARHLAVDRWLVPIHPQFPTLPDPKLGCRVDIVPLTRDPRELSVWFRGLDWILFVERPYLPELPQAARAASVGVACVPNWEWIHPKQDWLNYVDVMICPTRHTFAHITDWKRRYGFGWKAVYVPWPIDTDRFAFRQRESCRRFVFVDGWGGGHGRRLDGSMTEYPRKGMELIAQVARLAPHLPFTVYSQRRHVPDMPSHVEIRRAPEFNGRLYMDGDVCVQPSHWEGLGLQLLECQAAGMPLVTTDAPPMNEHQPLRTIPVAGGEIVFLLHDQPILSQLMTADGLAEVLQSLYGADISQASRDARNYIEREHSWDCAKQIITDTLTVV
jgi:glycosyltransferase involved in cell wall biosynthesis